MSTAREKYLTLFERWAKKCHLSYYPFMLLINPVPSFLTLAIRFLVLLYNGSFLLWKLTYEEIFWFIPGFSTWIAVTIALPSLRKRLIRALYDIEKYSNNFNEVLNFFEFYTVKSKLAFSVPFFFGLFAMLFQVYYLIINPHPWWRPWYEACQSAAFMLACISTYNTTVHYFLLTYYGWVCVVSFCTIYKYCGVIRKDICFPELQKIIFSLRDFTVFASIAWTICLGFAIPTIFIAPLTWWVLIQVLAYLFSIVLFFTISLYLIYKSTKPYIEDMKKKVYDTIVEVYRALENNLTNSKADISTLKELYVKLNMLKNLYQDLDNMGRWIYEVKPITKVAASVGVMNLVQYLLEICKKLLML